ncbi:helix-turn-helix domain-containing protein [Thioclava electrotropha]|uniref:GntR family transcriptional regulator n=1 Tax=Thioclava electrotropha TaxID=1549850 RepID=A0ABX6YWS8_9RHOB|nr:helix-turn-helix domain-containing protein [Thioclava electrotropha]QPZ92319.1 GntR family transcriptional regulator [Thioclava electrotropha]
MSENEDEATNVVPLNPKQHPQATLKVLDQKWGKETMEANYTVLPSALLRGQARLGINATELAVLVHLIDHWWKADEMPWPSKRTLADRLRVGEKTIQRAIAHLEEEGLIKRTPRFSKKTGARTSNEYDLKPLVERLKPIAQDQVQAAKEARAIKKKAEKPGLKRRSSAKKAASE